MSKLKYLDTQVVFREIPGKITLAINITNCPNLCKGCHSPELRKDIGEVLNVTAIDTLIDKNEGISCVCFMGGDAFKDQLYFLAKYIKKNYPRLSTAWYSGQNLKDISFSIDPFIVFDYIKLGEYNKTLGALDSKKTNQRLYYIKHNSVDVELVEYYKISRVL